MTAPNFLSEEELNSLYWDRINVSYSNEFYKNYTNNTEEDESFPMAISQLLSNSLSYLKFPLFQSISNNSDFYENKTNNKNYFDYMTYLIIENGYNNILPNLFNKILKIPKILNIFNKNLIKKIDVLIIFYFIIIFVLCIILFYLFYITNKSMIEGMDKVSKIKLEKIEEILKKIRLFNSNLKKFRDKDIKIEDNKEKSEINDDDSLIKSKNKNDCNSNKKGSSLVNNNGFNIDNNKYVPLRVLKYLYFHSLFILAYIVICLTLVYYYSYIMITNTNKLLLVESYIFGKLIATSTSIIEIKCYISECRNKTQINYTELVDYSKIKEIIKGLNLFTMTSYFYNENFLLNACGAAITNTSSEEYFLCLNDTTIITTNNTENLLKYVDDLISILKKEFEINNNTVSNYYRKNLFNETYYKDIEKIFFKYFIGVDENFILCLSLDLSSFLLYNQILVIILMLILTIIVILFCVISRITIIKKLILYITISRCVMKIIPTSVILNTPELEGWIENKY